MREMCVGRASGFGTSFAQLVRDICRRHGSIAEAARVGKCTRGWLSRVAKGSERPPSLARLEELMDHWGCSPDDAERLRQAAVWEKANPAAKVLLRRAGLVDGKRESIMGGRTRLVLLMTAADAGKRMFEEYVPLAGSYTRAKGMLSMLDDSPDGEAEYLAFGPVPVGSVAVRVDEEIEGYHEGVILVFGPEAPVPGSGFGLFTVRGAPPDVVARFEKHPHDVHFLGEREVTVVPEKNISAFRPFLTAV